MRLTPKLPTPNDGSCVRIPTSLLYMAVTLAMEASHRCVHGNSYSFYPLPRAYGNEYELVWGFDSPLCY